jgi:hypothetical protein
VIVHDFRGRAVVLLNSALEMLKPVADATEATNNAYTSYGGIIPWLGDSTLFIDEGTISILVIDGGGRIARVAALPWPIGPTCFIGGPSGAPSVDSRGRIVCRMPAERQTVVPQAGVLVPLPVYADSAPLIRYDLQRRRMDTAAFVRLAKTRMTFVPDEECTWFMMPLINPMSVVDDWTVSPDGSIVLIRGRDYHIDWIDPDGSSRATARVPNPPRRLSDDEKAAFVDSTRKYLEKLRGAAMGGERKPEPAPGTAPSQPACDQQKMTRIRMMKPVMTEDPASMFTSGYRVIPPLPFVDPAELPDYVPAFAAGSTLGDAEGNIWVRTLEVVAGGSIYDVVRHDGTLAARVQVPPGRVIAGFGTGGAVYMGVSVEGGVRLERARFK